MANVIQIMNSTNDPHLRLCATKTIHQLAACTNQALRKKLKEQKVIDTLLMMLEEDRAED